MRARRKKIPDPVIFAAIVRVMLRAGPQELTLAAIAAESGLTAGALVQRFGSKRELMLAHARYAAMSGDIGLTSPPARKRSALGALRNLAYLQRDLADPALYANLLRMNKMARKHYEHLISNAVAARELRADTPVARLARAIEVTLIGSFVTWTIYREGTAARWLRRDLDAVLRPHR